jgi:hypothetical protein
VSRLVALACLLAAAGAAAAPPRAEVERLLGGYETHATPEHFRRLGPGVDHVLVVIAIDPATSRVRRNRALYALAIVPSVEGRDLLRAVVKEQRRATEGADVLDLATAARALGAFGAEVAMDVVPLLAHPTGDVREAAADALGGARAVEALGSLRVRLGVEREEGVRRALVRAIGRLEGR